MREKTYKQIEASRNTRLWITSVVIPITTTGVGLFTAMYGGNPNFRNKVNEVTGKITSKFKKKEEWTQCPHCGNIVYFRR
jgi:hypothetical protein